MNRALREKTRVNTLTHSANAAAQKDTVTADSTDLGIPLPCCFIFDHTTANNDNLPR